MRLMVNEFKMLVSGWAGALVVVRLVASLTNGFGMSALGQAGASVVMGLRVVSMGELRAVIISFGILVLGQTRLRTGRLEVNTNEGFIEASGRRTYGSIPPCGFSRTPKGGRGGVVSRHRRWLGWWIWWLQRVQNATGSRGRGWAKGHCCYGDESQTQQGGGEKNKHTVRLQAPRAVSRRGRGCLDSWVPQKRDNEGGRGANRRNDRSLGTFGTFGDDREVTPQSGLYGPGGSRHDPSHITRDTEKILSPHVLCTLDTGHPLAQPCLFDSTHSTTHRSSYIIFSLIISLI